MFDLRKIMLRAWVIYRKEQGISFAEALHRSWGSAKAEPENNRRIEAAKQSAAITEDVNTWAGWRKAGYEVLHGSRALFQAVLIHASKGDGATYTASFFSRSQVQAIG